MQSIKKHSLNDLLELMSRLRDPEKGCPWDLKQSYSTITDSTIEEAYEVVDAIESGDFSHLKEELGDLLFQVVFYSQMANEDSLFNFSDVVDTLTAKLIRRHPHVFPDGTLESENRIGSEDDSVVKARWEEIKKNEREQKGKAAILDDVPIALPAMTRALKLQKRASSVGFDWPDLKPVFAKVKEEVDELEEVINLASKEAIEEELGDLMFSLVNLARHLKLDPERTLRKANGKFVSRFSFVESSVNESGRNLQDVDLQLMEGLWGEAKKVESKDG